jgi:hypothetical protein
VGGLIVGSVWLTSGLACLLGEVRGTRGRGGEMILGGFMVMVIVFF